MGDPDGAFWCGRCEAVAQTGDLLKKAVERAPNLPFCLVLFLPFFLFSFSLWFLVSKKHLE